MGMDYAEEFYLVNISKNPLSGGKGGF